MRNTSIVDKIVIRDYYSTPEILIHESYDVSRESKFAIIAEQCFDYYINNITHTFVVVLIVPTFKKNNELFHNVSLLKS